MKMRISASGVEFIPYGPGELRGSVFRAIKMVAVTYASFVVFQTLLIFGLDQWL